MKVLNNLIDSTDLNYFDEDLIINFLSKVKLYGSNSLTEKALYPDDQSRIKYKGDLFGYLLHERVPPQYLHFIMYYNDYKSPDEFPKKDIVYIKVPDYSSIEIAKETIANMKIKD